MPLLNMLAIVVCLWLLLLAVTGVIEHLRLRRDERARGLGQGLKRFTTEAMRH